MGVNFSRPLRAVEACAHDLFTALQHEPELLGALDVSVDLLIVRGADSVLGDADFDAHATAFAAALLDRMLTCSIAPRVDLTAGEPFNVARELATLDILCDGRAALVVAAPAPAPDRGRVGVRYRDLYDPALFTAEAIEVLRALWDSWDADAVVRDWPTNRFVDADRVHRIDYLGRVLRVRGPSATPRTPQGVLPVIADIGAMTTVPHWASSADLIVASDRRVATAGPRVVRRERADSAHTHDGADVLVDATAGMDAIRSAADWAQATA